MTINLNAARQLLRSFKFTELFVNEFGWKPPSNQRKYPITADGVTYSRQDVAEMSGVRIFEITSPDGHIPPAKLRAVLAEEISQISLENLIIFTDNQRHQSIWYWGQRQGTKTQPREHLYIKHQPGDLLLGKISALEFTIADFDAGKNTVFDIASRLQKGFDVEKVAKKFFGEFAQIHQTLLENISGIEPEKDRRWYASVILNRLMFVYFLQGKGFLDQGDTDYLQHKLAASQEKGENLYYSEFLPSLFFDGFAKPEAQRDPQTQKLIGKIKYLSGGLFLRHPIEQQYDQISIPDSAFASIFRLFESYSWNLDDTTDGKDNEINPAILGYIFEKYINQKEFGAYYTRNEITEYLCDRTINQLILDAVTPHPLTPSLPHPLTPSGPHPLTPSPKEGEGEDVILPSVIPPSPILGEGSGVRVPESGVRVPGVSGETNININDIIANLDAKATRRLLLETLPKLTLLDPACGSGAFLVAAMQTLKYIYSTLIGKIEYLQDNTLTAELEKIQKNHPSLDYFITKQIITQNLYGVDIMAEATEIAKLRLFLALVACASKVEELEPLPNIDFNIMAGNSLIGLMEVQDTDYDGRHGQLDLFTKTYRQVLDEKNRLIANYRNATAYSDDLQKLRDDIAATKAASIPILNEILRDEFTKQLKIKYEQAQLTGKPQKRDLKPEDIAALQPFPWGYEFDEIIQQRGGFDAIITNPPWEIFKPNAKEFFSQYSDLVTKKKMDIKSFEKQQKTLLQDSEIASAWLEYLSKFPHVSAYYRSAPQYHNQIAIVNGKKQGTDINLYKLFLEQCFNLLRPGGECGIVIPSGIYTDLGAKQLREMLFGQTQVTGLFGFENRRAIFEGVDSRFKFVVLTLQKGGKTQQFPAEFMRHDVTDLAKFPSSESLSISVELVRRLSPDSISVMEFKGELDIHIAEKMARFPLLGEQIPGKWNLKLTSEFHMTNDSHLFQQSPGVGRLPLYEGKMIEQFNHKMSEPRYWVEGAEGRAAILGQQQDNGQILDYQTYRAGFRKVARNTDSRTIIATIIPPTFHAENFQSMMRCHQNSYQPPDNQQALYLVAMWNSFVLDYAIRFRVSANINFFYMYQLPVPRLTAGDEYFADIVSRAAKLICTAPEFDDLAKSAGIGSHKNGVTDEAERAKLRAELDGMIAHLYGLTESEFAHILGTFPIVDEEVKAAALAEFRRLG